MLVNIRKLKFKTLLTVFICLATIGLVKAQERKTFSNLNEVLTFAKQRNYLFKNAELQTKLADLTIKTAFGNVFNPRVPVSFQLIDNTQQQKSFLPGEIFGQAAGTVKGVVIGQQYSAIFSIQPQFEILNFAGREQIKSAKINQLITENQNRLTEQKTYDQINAIYFNIVSFQGQMDIIKQNISIADTIFSITKNRFNEGISRKQEANEAEVNLINLQDKLEQLQLNIKIQEESLALFFENSIYPKIMQSVDIYGNNNETMQTNNTLQTQNTALQLQMVQQDLRVAKAQNLPTLSFVSSFNWQNLSNDFFFHANSNGIAYNYVGLRANWDLPTTVSKLSTLKNKQFQSEILKTTAEHTAKETETKNRQMILDYEKVVAQLQNLKKIVLLKEDTYAKNLNQYQERILGLDKLLLSQNELLIAKLNVVGALANIGFNKSKIEINNSF